MGEMVIRFAKKRQDGTPVLSMQRADGSVAWQRQDRFFPTHDLTHYAVETTLGLREAFWGMMADGWEFSDFGSPWPRGKMPNEPEAGLAEALVGLFDQLSLADPETMEDAEAVNALLEQYFNSHGRPLPRRITAGELATILQMRRDLIARWKALPDGEALELVFPRPDQESS